MMQELLLDVWTRLRTTVVFVTHDIDEALFLGDRVLIMSACPGRILESLRVDFARPRRRELMAEPDFVRLKRHCLELLRHRHLPPLPRLMPLGFFAEETYASAYAMRGRMPVEPGCPTAAAWKDGEG